MSQKAVGVIPARYGSTRFPGKPLAPLAGKPLLQWVIEGSQKCAVFNEILVATDSEEIAELCRKLSVRAVMTPTDVPTGSDRVWQAVENENFEIVVNIQGDEPLVNAQWLTGLVQCLQSSQAEMATLGRPLQSDEDLKASGAVKVITNHQGEAIYFSRATIPYTRERRLAVPEAPVLKHIGLYAYRQAFLQQFCQAPVSALERAEGLEQLRALYLGAKIQVLKVDHDSWGVDTPEDIPKIEALLKERI